MKFNIDMISIITHKFDELVRFYNEVLGFDLKLKLENYVEFDNEGVRFAITTPVVMENATTNDCYSEEHRGQSFELAFAMESPDLVDKVYQEIIEKGATPIKAPADMPWGQRTAFFADPDANIHEIFSDLP
ncbi:MAG: VOC family protein [Candidatus Heimdallarchaeota archaeon]|nr:VOC family protein [Candidatus Heimdallarchaeota archaeon]